MIRYIKTTQGIVDTQFLFPHLECYLIKDNVLYVEEISGRTYPFAEIIDSSDNEEDLIDESDD